MLISSTPSLPEAGGGEPPLPSQVDGDEAVIYEESSKRRRATELKPGGADEPVTAANVEEYLRLWRTLYPGDVYDIRVVRGTGRRTVTLAPKLASGMSARTRASGALAARTCRRW